MKTAFPNSAKRVLSLVLSLVMLVGTMFVANVGVNISAGAETATTQAVEKRGYVYWDGTAVEPTEKDSDGNILIKTAEQFNWVCAKASASVSGGRGTAGKKYKVDPTITAFIMQKQSVISSYLDTLLALSGGEATRVFYEETLKGKDVLNWTKNGLGVFSGTFDGSGVPVYGVYSSNTTYGSANESCALFGVSDGGGKIRDSYTDTITDEVGSTIKNIAVRNSYFQGFRRVAVITGCGWWPASSNLNVIGYVNINSCEVSNCYVLGQNMSTKDGKTYFYNTTAGAVGAQTSEFKPVTSEYGILAGGMGHDVVRADGCLMYGNKSEYDLYTCSSATSTATSGSSYFYTADEGATISETPTTTDAIGGAIFGQNGKNNAKDFYGSITNSIIFDSKVANLSGNAYVSNVYSNVASSYSNVTVLASAEDTKGSLGKTRMSGLTWATAETAGNGTTQWYAIEDDYPTLFMPAGWEDNVKGYSIWSGNAAEITEGKGTKEEPFIIRTADQLYKMVCSSGKDESGNSQYFKVADGVDKLYLNDILLDESLDGIKALVAKGSSSYKNWDATSTFFGKFDGNGVTISGMVSYNKNAFINDMQGQSEVKNIHFENCYVYDSGFAAIVTTKTAGSYSVATNTPVISNVSVRHSYIESTSSDKTSPFLAKKTYNDSDGTQFKITGETVNTNGEYATTLADGTLALQASANAGGIVAFGNTTKNLVVKNCLFDGRTSEIKNGSASTVDGRAGIVAAASGVNNYEVFNCVSLGYPVVSEAITNEGVVIYNRYSDWYAVNLLNCYTDVALNLNSTYASRQWDMYYETKNNVVRIAKKDQYATTELPTLDWFNTWSLVTDGGYTIPMPTGVASEASGLLYSNVIATLPDKSGGVGGANEIGGNGGRFDGTYGLYEYYTGSGTADDPYMITTPLELALAISTGGKNITQKLYYKLACDIDLEGATWIDQKTISGKYRYVKFEGTLDGAGHIVSNFSAIDTNSAGLIPVLNGGTVKNLHVRNAYAGSTGKAGVLVGEVENGGTIIGCSVEDGTAVGTETSNMFVNGSATITDSYYTTTDAEGKKTATYLGAEPTDLYSKENTAGKWYKVPNGDGIARLVSMAKACMVTDIDGDGEFGGEFFTAQDITALRRRLLDHSDYANVYGDINADGKISITDLALVRRQMTETYNSINDGLWRNIELGKVNIYYGENDNYDAARKLQLALEAAFGEDTVQKIVVASNVAYGPNVPNVEKKETYVHTGDIYTTDNGTSFYKVLSNDETGAFYTEKITDDNLIAEYALDGKQEIIVGDIANYKTSDVATNNYAIVYEKANNALWFQGGSFTGVEQAVIDFIAKSNPADNYVYSTSVAQTLDDEKIARDLNGDSKPDYYYAWGDEFKGVDNFDPETGYGTGLDLEAWSYGSMHNETSKVENEGSKYFPNLEVAFPDDMGKLYDVKDGKLTIWRGYYGNSGSDLSWGYKYLGKLSDKGVTPDMSGTTDSSSVRGEDYISNLFGGRVESTDTYATAGLIETERRVLAKQGYLEMKASYPTDGHVFACWWLHGFAGNNSNSAFSNSLYGKVFKLNNAAAYADGVDSTGLVWDGTNWPDSRYPNTFKYQLPNSSFEIDIAELMQGGGNFGNASYMNANFTFHKFYQNGIYTDSTDGLKKIKFINWDNLLSGADSYYHTAQYISSHTVETKYYQNQDPVYSYATTDTFLPNAVWNGNLTSTNDKENSWDSSYTTTYTGYVPGMLENSSDAGNYFSGTPAYVTLKANTEYIFGVEWNTDGKGGATFKFTVKEVNSDGSVGAGATMGKRSSSTSTIATGEVTVTDYDYDEDDGGFLTSLSQIASDASVANQYMHMLIDNTYYTSKDGTVDSSLLTNTSNNKTGTMVIDYVRVYQQDGRRDIVTPETEDFNNGNHFGY